MPYKKNPGITKSEITNIKDKICNLLNLDNKKIIIKALLPGLYSIEKNN